MHTVFVLAGLKRAQVELPQMSEELQLQLLPKGDPPQQLTCTLLSS